MKEALDALLLALGLLVGLWIVVFGVAGALLSNRAGLSRMTGLLVGTALGPIGVGWLAWRGRATRQPPESRPETQPAPDESGPGFLI